MEDKLLKEIRAIKDNLASKYNYDLTAIFNDIIRKQKTSKHIIINLKKKGLKKEASSAKYA